VWLVGEYDLGITFWTKTDTEFKNALENLIVQIEDNFQDKYISKVIGLDQYNYPIEKYERTKISIKETKNIEQIDGLDIKILKQLNKNARLTSTQISRAIKSNYKIVAYRIKRLIEKKILIGARCDINYTLLGHHNSKIFIYLKHDAERTKQLISYIENLKQTIYIVNQIGSADLDIELIAENELEYDKIISQMIDTFSDIIITLKQMNFQKTIKISYLPKMD
jgi:DNA-binding Lrp family transcriptional regulator